MKKLLVLANEFPYGQTEPYMETEEKYYKRFDKVWIGSLQLRKTTAISKRSLDCQAEIIPVWYKSRLFYLINSFTVLFDCTLYKEIHRLIKSKKFSCSRLITLFVYLSRAHHEARVVNRALKNEKKEDFLIYSYRFEYQPYVALLLKKWWGNTQSIICRAHGYDLYEERHNDNYIPLRQYVLDNVNYVFPCSQNGVSYINKKYNNHKAIVDCRYLGTSDYGVKEFSTDENCIEIVSCSNVNKVKRIDKIIEALQLLEGMPIVWTHFGGGDLLEEIRNTAKQKMKGKIKYNFPGNISNCELFERYLANNYRLFINVSSSEGLPVSIMEPMSVGIPCIATDVGGTNEIVKESNGFLLPAEVTIEEIATAIKNMIVMEDDEYFELRKNAREYWENHFDANKNYGEFIEELHSL